MFQSRRNGNLDVFVMNADGSELSQLTDNPAHDYVPSWSADGQQIYFASWRLEEGENEPQARFYVMNSDGSGQTRLDIEPPGTSGPLVASPDGRRLAYASRRSEDGSEIRVRDIGTEGTVSLASPPGFAGAPSFAPDGRRIAYYVHQEESSVIMVADLVSGSAETVLQDGRNWQPSWSPDGQWLVVSASADSEDRDLDLFFVKPEKAGEAELLFDTDGRTSEASWRPRRPGEMSATYPPP